MRRHRDVGAVVTERPRISVRQGTIEDAEAIFSIKADAVTTLCSQDYTDAQIKYWTRARSQSEMQRKVADDPTFVVLFDHEMIGYSQVSVESGEILAVYVLPAHGRLGAGAAVLAAAEKCAILAGHRTFWLDASITAEKFYRACGYSSQYTTSFPMDDCVELPCIRMTKSLEPNATRTDTR